MRKNIGYGLLQLFFLACFVPVVLTTCQKLPLNPYDPEAVELGFLTDLPVIATDEGTYHKDITVAISCPDPWASVYYTTDGTDPTESSNLYVGPIPVEGDGTSVQIKAVAKNPERDFSGIISRRFTIAYFSLELRVSGNGSVSPSGPLKVSEGGSVMVTATPESGNAFGMWSVIAGSGVVIEDPYDPVTTVTLTTGNGTVQADFAAAYTLTLTTDGNGTTDPAGVVEVAAGYPRTVQALPFAGCVFSYWEDPGSTGAIIQDINRAATSITLTEGDANIEANFIPWPQKDKILASDGAALDYFGYAVAISGDYAVIGAYGESDKKGAAYIFHRTDTGWVQEAKITASDGAVDDRFGTSVAISGDYVVIGADYHDENGTQSGSAYIFHRNGTSWTQEAELLASDGAAGDYFGHAVALSGDRAVVGAADNDDAGSSSGSAYVFYRDGTDWSEEANLTASDGAAYDYFGRSVAVSDGFIVVGAEGDDVDFEGSGSAYIFHWDGTDWTEQEKLHASDGAIGQRFGSSVSISGDCVALGAVGDDEKANAAGALYIFRWNGTAWTEEAKLLASDGAESDWLGSSVSIAGDCVVAGAPYNDDGGAESGSAYIFRREGTSLWTQQVKLLADVPEGDVRFGTSVSLYDGHTLVGGYLDDENGNAAGSAYIFGGE